MKKLTAMILATTVVLGSISCKKDTVGEGPVKTENRFVPNFTAIDLQMNGNVYYTRDLTSKMEITAKESIHDMLETTVIDNRLVIRYKNGKTYDNDNTIRINISAPEINSFQLNTSGNIYVTNNIEQAGLSLRSYGSGSIFLKNVFVNTIYVESNQSGLVSATGGTASNLALNTYGSGKIDFVSISSRHASVHTQGSGDVRVNVSDDLDATIDGSGSVYYTGYPFIRTHISGSGHLVHL
jgi:hypothetical protein